MYVFFFVLLIRTCWSGLLYMNKVYQLSPISWRKKKVLNWPLSLSPLHSFLSVVLQLVPTEKISSVDYTHLVRM